MNFCTLFDSSYLTRGLAMYYSLIQHSPNSKLFVICLDDKLFKYLTEKQLIGITPINLKEVETCYNELEKAKNNRTYVEYIFTLSPVIALFIFERFPSIEMITTLDADIFFFADPSILFKDSDSFSIAITPHRFNDNLKSRERFGIYNVSFQTFKNDEIGRSCLNEWKENCINWCYDKLENNKFADQKYLDDWPNKYSNIKEYSNGAGVAPWNIKDIDISKDTSGNILIKNETLVYYHFCGLRNLSNNWLSIGLSEYRVERREKIIKYIYLKYINSLSDLRNELNSDQIVRGTHSQFGKIIFKVFLADLYFFKNGELIRILNLNFFRKIYVTIKDRLTLHRN